MKTKRGFLISFSGIDGSGKTALSKILVERLNNNGIKCKHVYGRLEPFIIKLLIWIGRKLFLKKQTVSKDYAKYSSAKKEVIKRHTFLVRVYLSILLLDYILQLLYKFRLPRMLGKNIVCDRYVYDTVITDLAVDMGLPDSKIRDLIEKLLCIASKPNVAFLLDLPEEIAFQRKGDTPSIEYLRERRCLYLAVGNEHNMIILDGTKKLEELVTLILKKLYKL